MLKRKQLHGNYMLTGNQLPGNYMLNNPFLAIFE